MSRRRQAQVQAEARANPDAILGPLERVTFWLCDGIAYEMTHPGVLEDWNSMVQRSRAARAGIAAWHELDDHERAAETMEHLGGSELVSRHATEEQAIAAIRIAGACGRVYLEHAGARLEVGKGRCGCETLIVHVNGEQA